MAGCTAALRARPGDRQADSGAACQCFPLKRSKGQSENSLQLQPRLNCLIHLTGGAVSSAYGEPRLTQDIDIVISPEIMKLRLEDFVDQLSNSDFLYTESVVRRSVQSGDLFQLLDKNESLKLDIYPRETDTR